MSSMNSLVAEGVYQQNGGTVRTLYYTAVIIFYGYVKFSLFGFRTFTAFGHKKKYKTVYV